MSIERTFLILRGHNQSGEPLVTILAIKHPIGVDPIQRMEQAALGYILTSAGSRLVEGNQDIGWSDIFTHIDQKNWDDLGLSVEQIYPKETFSLRSE